MTDPKIKYDIEADAKGGATVDALAKSLETLDDAIDPALVERSRALSEELRRLGEQQDAIERFRALKEQTQDAAAALRDSQSAAQALAREMAAAGTPTKAQAGQMEKLRDAVRQTKEEFSRQTAQLDAARQGLTALGVPIDGLASRQAELRGEIAATATALQRVGDEAGASRSLGAIAQATDQAASSLGAMQGELQTLGARMAATEAPTAAQVQRLDDMAQELQRSRAQLDQQVQALASQRAALQAAGVSTTELDRRQAELGAQVEATSAELQQLSTRAHSLRGFADLVHQTEAAREALFLADRALTDYRAGLSATASPTDAQARRMGALAEETRQAQISFQGAAQAQAQAAAGLRAAGVDTDRLVAAQQRARAETSAMAQAGRDAAAAAALQSRAFVEGANRQAQAASGLRSGLKSISEQLAELQQLAAVAIGGQLLGGLAGDIARTADAYTDLAARIRLVTGEGAAFDQAFEGVFDIATRTNTSLETTGTLFQRIAQAGKEIQLGNQAALALTETINQAVQVSGGSVQAADAAITQLIQGLQSGVLRGQEFNSVMEQAPRLARALADGLGVTTGELRKQAEAGRLTSQVVIQALQGQADVVAREFDKLPPTVGRAIQNLGTEWTRYVGEVDKANGISTAAAAALNTLARNLDSLGTVLIQAGKAALALKAFDLAATFAAKASAARQAAAATAAETTATVANTAAVAANTTAQQANNAAKAGAVKTAAALGSTYAGLGARLMAGVATLGAIGAAVGGVTVAASVLINALKSGGTALGEWIARLAGARDRSADLERQHRAEAEAAAENARQLAALAQAQQLASDRSLDLTKAARQLISEFEGVIAKGGNVAEALDKVAKGLQLGDTQGIRDAGAALDALALKGQVTATQVREALAAALSGQDLGVFETQARAAFDGSAQGARRLAAAIDAIGTEALTRAGTSARELQTGFSAAMSRAVNDVDALTAELARLGANGPEVARVLDASLDKALAAANTERAIQAVIDRWESLGQQGLVTGDQLAAGLDKARAKLDELRPGVSSLDEALKTFGLKSQAQLQQTADTFGKAWEQIRNSTTVALADKIKAFEQYRAAAIAANDGILPSELRLQEEMLRLQQAARSTSQVIGSSMDAAGPRVDALTDRVNRLSRSLAAAGQIGQTVKGPNDDFRKTPVGTPATPYGAQPVLTDDSVFQDLVSKYQAGTLAASDLAAAQSLAAASRENARTLFNMQTAFGMDTRGTLDKRDAQARDILAAVEQLVRGAKTSPSQAKSVRVTVDMGGKSTDINVVSDTDATVMQKLLQQLADAKRVSR